MKFFKILLISCLMLIAAQSLAFAGSGKAIVPHWYVYNDGNTNIQTSNIFISNISKNDLIVKITLYNKDSTVYAANIDYHDFQNNNTEIGAGKSVNYKINANSIGTEDAYGYAVIEWSNKNDDNDTIGLVAWADWTTRGENKGYAVTVNNGMPF